MVAPRLTLAALAGSCCFCAWVCACTSTSPSAEASRATPVAAAVAQPTAPTPAPPPAVQVMVPVVPPLVKVQRDADQVLRTACAGCHPWTTGSVRHLAAACGERGTRLVVPNDLARSRLYGKVAGSPGCGGPMPPTGSLPPSSIAALRAWILSGAPVDGVVESVSLAHAATRSTPLDDLDVNELNRDD